MMRINHKCALLVALLVFVSTLLVTHRTQEYVMVAVSREGIRASENQSTYINSVYVRGVPEKYVPENAILATTSEKAIELLQGYTPIHGVAGGSILTWDDFVK